MSDLKLWRPFRTVVTGATGFFGWHLRCRMHAQFGGEEARALSREAFEDDGALSAALKGAEAVIHLAGSNRGAPEYVYASNVAMAERLVAALDEVGGSPHVVYADSRHRDGTTPYGTSKRCAALMLEAWAERAGAVCTDLVLPNLFGEHSRPDYNSAIATFVRDLAEGRPSDVNPDGSTELLHVQAAAALVMNVLSNGRSGRIDVAGVPVSVPSVYERLQRLHAGYTGALLPELNDRLDLELFNTLRSAMFPAAYPMSLEPHTDRRGVFVELVRGYGDTQTSFSTTKPGITRGGHYHFDKVERFVVLEGVGLIRLRRLLTTEVVEFRVSSDHPVAVDMPTLHTHDITNVGEGQMLTAFWANDHFDPMAPDTYVEPVLEAELSGAAR